MSILKIRKADGTIEEFPMLKGKSAYEIALSHGFVGTEEEWNNSVQKSQDNRLSTTDKTIIGSINEVNLNKANKNDLIEITRDELSQEGISDTIHTNLNTTDKTIIGSINEVNQQNKQIEERFDGKSFKYLTQAEYDLLTDEQKNNETIVYCITDAEIPSGVNSNLISPDGNEWVLKVSNSGVLSVEKKNPPVTIPVTSVSLDKTTHTFKGNETIQLNATVLPSNASNKNVTWASSDTSKATVVNGLVAAKAEGSCVITVTTVDGNKTVTCNITIDAKNEVNPIEFINYAYNTETFDNPSSDLVQQSSTYYQTTGYLKSVADGILKGALNTTTCDNAVFAHRFTPKGQPSEIWYYQVKIRTTLSNFNISMSGNIHTENIVTNEWFLCSDIYTGLNGHFMMVNVFSGSAMSQTVEIKEPMLINLTEVFGNGKEPTTKNECDNIFTTYKSGLIG